MEFLPLLCLIGILISFYAVHVETENSKDENYNVLCDLGEGVSCSNVLTSDYAHLFSKLGVVPKGTMFDQSNATLGVLFYLLVYLANYFKTINYNQSNTNIQYFILGMTTFGLGMSMYLAYVLFFLLDDICMVCIATYVVNTMLFVEAYKEYYSIASTRIKNRKK